MHDIYKSILLIYKKGKHISILLTVLIVGNGILLPLSAYFIKSIIDVGANELKMGTKLTPILPWVFALVGVLILYNLRELLEQLLKVKLSHKLRDEIMPKVVEKYKKIEYSCFEDKETQDLLSRVGSNPEETFTSVFGTFLFLPRIIVQLIGYSCFFISVGWWVLATLILIAIPTFIISIKNIREDQNIRINQTSEQRKANYISSLITSRNSAKEVRIFSLGSYLNKRWYASQNKLLLERIEILKKQNNRSLLINMLELIFVSSCLIIFTMALINNKITFGLYVAIITQLVSITNIITWDFPYNMITFAGQTFHFKDFQKFMDIPERKIGVLDFTEEFHVLEFKNVYFSYPKSGKCVLNGVNFKLSNGEKIAIVGENGAGKTTIIKLILGFYTPNSGQITINGVDILDYSDEAKHKIFSAAFQDFVSYSLTIRENIAIGNINRLRDDEYLINVSKQATSDDFLNNIGINKYLGKIFEGGIDLSYGQWQRLSIARALAAGSNILLLDEPTASVDPIVEMRIYESFINSFGSNSCILISHRLGSARLADKILVLSDGVFKEQGSHDELIKLKGIYAKMFDSQAEWYKDEVNIYGK